MSKSKSSKAVKPTKSDALTKAKDAAVAKPAQTVKAKSKELAKQVVAKEEKKNKKSKKVKEPTPEPSDSEDSESSESESSASENEEVTKPVANGKASGAKQPVVAKHDSESDASDSDSDESSEDEAPKANGGNKKTATTNGKAIKPADDSDNSASDSDDSVDVADLAVDAASSDDDSDESADDSSEDEKPTKVASKAVEVKKGVKAHAKSSASDSEEDSEEDSDSSDENENEEEEKPAPKPAKRKAEEDPSQTVKKTKTEALDTSKGANLFVGNLSWNVDEAWLKEVFEEFGEVSGVRIMTDRATGRSKGFGYVEFVNAEDAAQAHAAKQGADLDNRTMNVDFANARPDNSQKQENRRKSYGDSVSEPSDTLFIGNLSFDVGQETVTEAFQPHGTILGIRLPTDRETGQPKGFGYVTFASIDEATSAMGAMQGAYIEGRPVRLDYSSPRPQNNDSPAGGRGGFGGRGGPRGGARGGRGGRGSSFGGRGGRGGGRGGSTNRGGFGDFSGRKTSFD